jgi:hypothetical protein
VSGSSSPYGSPAGIIPYTGDTTLLVDVAARAFVVLDRGGNVTAVMSPPRANDVSNMASPSFGAARLDPKGRLIYRSMLPMAFRPPEPGKPFVLPTMPDSAPIVRADFDTRRADTLAWVRVPKITVASSTVEGGAGETFRPLFNPLGLIDDWAMLSMARSRFSAAATITSTGSTRTARASRRPRCHSIGSTLRRR